MIPIVLRTDVPESLAVQIALAVRAFVATGALEPGEPVPSSRALAQQLQVSRGTVVAAYDQLIAESYLVATPGGKTRIHPKATSRIANTPLANPKPPQADRRPNVGNLADFESTVLGQQGAARDMETYVSDAQYGETASDAGTRQNRREVGDKPVAAASGSDNPHAHIDLTPHVHQPIVINDSSWREAWRAAATSPAARTADLRDSTQGITQLRDAIAEHLRLMRSMIVDPADIFVTTGARDGLALTLAALEPHSEVGVEAPGYPGLRRVLRRAGATAVDLPVDEQGIVVDSLPERSAAVLVTPNHLFPVGGSMPAPRRLELLAQAQRMKMLVIEDDLDSEYRHVGAVMPSLWELAPQSVVHLGTFNQVLTPDARIGYLIAPRHLHEGLAAARGDLGSGASAIAQRAVASYLHGGGLRRTLIRRRREIVRRKDLIFSELGHFAVQTNAGANAIIELPSQTLSEQVQREAARRGVIVGDLADYWSAPKQAPVAGIVIAYGDQILDDLARAATTLAQVLATVGAQ